MNILSSIKKKNIVKKINEFFILIVVFFIAFPGTVWGQESTIKEQDDVVGFRTVHLLKLKNAEDEAEFAIIADDFNKVVVELGYQNIRYNFWKETGDNIGQYKYIFESNWPDQETYDEVHEYEEFKLVWEKSYSKWKKMIEEDNYNRYILVNKVIL
jgi:hypothetical protein